MKLSYEDKVQIYELKKCGSSSVVEHHLAKVGVAGSNPVVRLERPGWRNWQTHRT